MNLISHDTSRPSSMTCHPQQTANPTDLRPRTLQITVNNKLGVLKRVAYGFVNVDNFAARALLQTPGMAT